MAIYRSKWNFFGTELSYDRIQLIIHDLTIKKLNFPEDFYHIQQIED